MPIFCCIPDLPFQNLVTTSEYINSSTLLWAVWEPAVSTTHYHPSPISLENHLDYTEEINRVGQGMGGPTGALSHGIIKYQVPYFPEGYRRETTNVKKEGQSDIKTSYDSAYVWNLKAWYKWTYFQNRNRDTEAEDKLMLASWGGEKVGLVGRSGLIYAHYYT